jgi:23S rRNA (pseudouridine1915-N3)-methyltransferase
MRLTIVAVGQKVPDWAQTAYDDYAKRFPPELKVELKAVKTEPRASKTLDNLLSAERGRIEASIARGTRVVALDERGTAVTTVALAERLKAWQLSGDDVAIVIGGPDGLDAGFKQAAHERLRLSDLTLPHAMVRVLLIEQLYRPGASRSTTPTTENNEPPRSPLRVVRCPPRGPLRLRPGKAGSAAPAGLNIRIPE